MWLIDPVDKRLLPAKPGVLPQRRRGDGEWVPDYGDGGFPIRMRWRFAPVFPRFADVRWAELEG